MKEADNNKDGKLTYLEFKDAIKVAEKKISELEGKWSSILKLYKTITFAKDHDMNVDLIKNRNVFLSSA